MPEKHLEILSEGLTLRGVLYTPSRETWPLVLLCHGLLSHKDSSKYHQIAQAFESRGIATLRFDFRGCGESEGLLAESTVSGRWHDLQEAISLARKTPGYSGRLGLLGSSLGGFLALLEASRSPQVHCTAVWSTPSRLDGLEDILAQICRGPISPSFSQDVRRHDLLGRLGNTARVLIVHGQKDTLVPPEHAFRLYDALKPPKCLHLLPDSDHRLSFQPERQRAVAVSLAWFERHL